MSNDMLLARLFRSAAVPVKPERVGATAGIDCAHQPDICDVDCANIASLPLDLVQLFAACFVCVIIAMRNAKVEAGKLLIYAISKVTGLLAGPS